MNYHLDLSQCTTGPELLAAIATIPDDATSLDLGWNNLSNHPTADLVLAFRAIPPRIKSLHLNNCNLGNKNGDDLAQLFAAIPVTVALLNLKSNELGRRPAAQLEQAVAAIRATSLNLGWNEFFRRSGAEIAQVFTKLHAGMNSLDFKSNGLPSDELAIAFKSLSQAMQSVTISLNEIDELSEEEVITLGNALPYITELHIGNDSPEIMNHRNAVLLREHIGKWIKGAHKELVNVLGQDDMASIVLGIETGNSEKQLSKFAGNFLAAMNKANLPNQNEEKLESKEDSSIKPGK